MIELAFLGDDSSEALKASSRFTKYMSITIVKTLLAVLKLYICN